MPVLDKAQLWLAVPLFVGQEDYGNKRMRPSEPVLPSLLPQIDAGLHSLTSGFEPRFGPNMGSLPQLHPPRA